MCSPQTALGSAPLLLSLLLRRSAVGLGGSLSSSSFASLPAALSLSSSLRLKHSTAATASISTPEERMEAAITAFQADPLASASVIAEGLTPAHRAILLAALDSKTHRSPVPSVQDEAYLSELFKAVDTELPKGVLNRSEFEQALAAHTLVSHINKSRPPTRSALAMIFIASAIPFVAFGFLDNGIMIVAGEEIDHAFGAKLGMTTLASAGLGNLVADVCGVGAAGFIEESVKKLPGIKTPDLSAAQRSMKSVRAAKFSGSLVGVAIGCLLGLLPLVAMGGFFKPT